MTNFTFHYIDILSDIQVMLFCMAIGKAMLVLTSLWITWEPTIVNVNNNDKESFISIAFATIIVIIVVVTVVTVVGRGKVTF